MVSYSYFITIPPSAVASILIEPVQGEGGFIPAPVEFLRRAPSSSVTSTASCSSPTRSKSGYGRTGAMWAFQRLDIVPDVVVLAKSIANGLPSPRSSRHAPCRNAGAAGRTARRAPGSPRRRRRCWDRGPRDDPRRTTPGERGRAGRRVDSRSPVWIAAEDDRIGDVRAARGS